MTLEAMETTRARAVNVIMLAVLERPPEGRAAFLAEICHDADLRREVERLLALEDDVLQVLDRPLLEAENEAAPEQQIGPYRVRRPIGHGGMGTVYLATRRDTPSGGTPREVAIKILRPGLSEALARHFLNERRILAGLEHPGIARLYEDGALEDGRPYLVMEYVAGERIDRYCESKSLAVHQRLELFVEVCKTVAFAHRNRVIHRDLKPSNVLITDDGAPKLLDFGIAKLLDLDDGEPVTITATGLQALTPEYASPEQLAGQRVTAASDVYSLGVMLHELLSGQRPPRPSAGRRSRGSGPWFLPLGGDDAQTVVASHKEPWRQLVPRHLGALLPKFHRRRFHPAANLDAILRKALRHEPGERYASVAALLKDVRRHLAGRPSAAHRERQRQRYRLAAAILLLAGILAAFLGRDVPRELSPARLAVANAGFEAGDANGEITSWGPHGLWQSHAEHPRAGRDGLGARFASHSADAGPLLGQALDQRFAPRTAYHFRSWAAAGRDRHGRLPYQIGYAAVDGELSSFVPLATRLVDLEGKARWTRTEGVSYETGERGTELGRQIVVAFGDAADGGASDVFIDEVELLVEPAEPAE